MAKFKRNHDAENVVDMIKTMIINYVDLDGRMFIADHDTIICRFEIVKHFNDLKHKCIEFVKKYDSLLPDEYLNICFNEVSYLIYQAKHLMIDLYDNDLDDYEVLTRAIKRGDAPYEF